MHVSPSEVWNLTVPECCILLDLKPSDSVSDISMMINAERKMNGAKESKYLIQ